MGRPAAVGQASTSRDLDAYRCLTSVGLGLLYVSGYFLPHLAPAGIYFAPTDTLLQSVVIPSLLGVVLVSSVIEMAAVVIRRWQDSVATMVGGIAVFAFLALVGLQGILSIAGYDWENRIPRGTDLLAAQRAVKVAAAVIAMALFAITWRKFGRWARVMASLGFAFAAYACVRILLLEALPAPAQHSPPGFVSKVATTKMIPAPAPLRRSRRVVWVIFDEMDFDLMTTDEGKLRDDLTNFRWLDSVSVSAKNAHSPASSTLYSIPSLLTAVAPADPGIELNAEGHLFIADSSAKLVPFNDATSVFSAVESDGGTSSVLGFFHPYCKLFRLAACDSFAWPQSVGLAAVLTANFPRMIVGLFGLRDPWNSATQESLNLLPRYLTRSDTLTFIHLNFPHLPADYADKELGVSRSHDPLVEYAHNLRFTDRVLGEVLQAVTAQSARYDMLLVVSSDHWLRNRWYKPDAPEIVRRIPLFVWRANETAQFHIAAPLNTVNTAAMIMDYLEGKITSQSQIVGWWADRADSPSFIAPNT